MSKAPSLVNLIGHSRDSLTQYFTAWGINPLKVKPFMQGLYQKNILSFDYIEGLSKQDRAILKEHACLEVQKLSKPLFSNDQSVKWTMPASSSMVECVYLPEERRATLCVSSQCGCALKCKFCATGYQGFEANLSKAQILSQVIGASDLLMHHFPAWQAISNVVFMGMGEPLLNLEEVASVANVLVDDYAYSLAKRRVTISTSGIIPKILECAKRAPVGLAISLHAPDNDLRNEIVPINKKYPLEELIPALKAYLEISKMDRVVVEYVMIKNVNDSLAQAKLLANLLKDVPCMINLIPYNPNPFVDYTCSSMEQIEAFTQYLKGRNYVVTVRRTRGEDIQGACGQLVGAIKSRSKVRKVVC